MCWLCVCRRIDWASGHNSRKPTANYAALMLRSEPEPGRWEADGVRQLLYSTVGHDR